MQYEKSDLIHYTLLILLANLALTTLLVTFRPVLNYDGILYNTAAKAISEGSWQYASELYKGLFYPSLIHLTHTLTPLSLEHSAHFLNSILLTILSIGFVAVVYQLGGRSKKIIAISSLIILLFPSLLKYRPFIIRDFGFLACYIWSLFFLLRYQQSKHVKPLLIWSSILIFASFLRIESAAYLVIIAAFLLPWKKLALNTTWLILTIMAVIGVTFSAIFSAQIIEALSSIHPSLPYPFLYIDLAFTKLDRSLSNLDNNIISTLISTLWEIIYESLRRLEFVYAILAFIAVKKGWVLKNSDQRLIYIYYVLTSIIILTLFTVGARYFSSRYTMALVLTILTIAPFTLEKAYQSFNDKRRAHRYGLIILTLVLCILSAKRFAPNDHHLESSTGKWVINNLPENTILASNNSRILYYAEQKLIYFPNNNNRHYRYDTQYLLSSQNSKLLKKSDYLAFEVKRKNEDAVKQEQLFNVQYGSPVSVIKQSDKHYVNIYSLKQ